MMHSMNRRNSTADDSHMSSLSQSSNGSMSLSASSSVSSSCDGNEQPWSDDVERRNFAAEYESRGTVPIRGPFFDWRSETRKAMTSVALGSILLSAFFVANMGYAPHKPPPSSEETRVHLERQVKETYGLEPEKAYWNSIGVEQSVAQSTEQVQRTGGILEGGMSPAFESMYEDQGTQAHEQPRKSLRSPSDHSNVSIELQHTIAETFDGLDDEEQLKLIALLAKQFAIDQLQQQAQYDQQQQQAGYEQQQQHAGYEQQQQQVEYEQQQQQVEYEQQQQQAEYEQQQQQAEYEQQQQRAGYEQYEQQTEYAQQQQQYEQQQQPQQP